MMPALSPGRLLLVTSRGLTRIKVGDVLLLRSPHTSELLVKRVVGLNGDRVRGDGYDFVAPEGYVGVFGDNLGDGVDSRHFGPVRMAAVVGRVLFLRK